MFIAAVNIFSQHNDLRGDLSNAFVRFEVVRISERQTNVSARELHFSGVDDVVLVLKPHDLRSKGFHAFDNGDVGLTTVKRQLSRTYIGYVEGIPDSTTRINITDRGYEGFFRSADGTLFVEPASKYSDNASPDDYVFYRPEDSIGNTDLACGLGLIDKVERGKSLTGVGRIQSTAGLKMLEIATEADFQYVNTLGGISQANNEILGILNMIEGLYSEQLTLTISVVMQHTWTTADPYTGANPEALTRSFQGYWNANFTNAQYPRDTAHLFSGKPNVASQGWAFIGVLCSSPSASYGMSGYIDWAPGKYLITSHELAHNLGANHVDVPQNCGNSLMNAQLTGSTPTLLCQYSRNEVTNFVATNGSCITSRTASPFDLDGDSTTDISIFRPSVGEWWYLKSGNGGNGAIQFGSGTDKLTPGDFTGDGKTDIAFWRPTTGMWYVLRSEDFSFFSFPFGSNGDTPAPADYDGDGKTDAAVFRESTANWFILNSGGSGITIGAFGGVGDKPVVSDYDGDSKADIAIWRPSVGQWWISKSSTGQTLALTFGTNADRPVQGDYTGDGKADIAFWSPSTGFWFVQRSEDGSFFSFPYGTSGDVPAPGDYDGDGRIDATVFRPATSNWYSNRSTAGTMIVTFGAIGDVPVPSAFVP